MLSTGKTWKEVAEVLGVSTPAMSQWKTGKTKPSKQAIFLLEKAERAVGIQLPQPAPIPPRSGPETGPIKKDTISGKGSGKGDELMEIVGLLREAAERLEAYHRKQKGK